MVSGQWSVNSPLGGRGSCRAGCHWSVFADNRRPGIPARLPLAHTKPRRGGHLPGARPCRVLISIQQREAQKEATESSPSWCSVVPGELPLGRAKLLLSRFPSPALSRFPGSPPRRRQLTAHHRICPQLIHHLPQPCETAATGAFQRAQRSSLAGFGRAC